MSLDICGHGVRLDHCPRCEELRQRHYEYEEELSPLRAALARETERAERAEKRLEEAERLLGDAHAGAHMTYWHDLRAFLAAHEPKSGKGEDQTSPAFTESYPGGTLPNSPGTVTVAVHYGGGGDGGGSDPVAQGSNGRRAES